MSSTISRTQPPARVDRQQNLASSVGPALSRVVVGVDTHKATHHAAVVTAGVGEWMSDQEFENTAAGCAALLDWAQAQGRVVGVRIEQTGSYGRHLATVFDRAGLAVTEVSGPSPAFRAQHGKTDRFDAYHAAIAVLAQSSVGNAKQPPPIVAAIGFLMPVREQAVRARKRAWNQFGGMLQRSLPPLREHLAGLTPANRLDTARRFRPNPARLDEPLQMQRQALKRLATRIAALDTEIKAHDRDLARLVKQAAPELLDQPQIGPVIAAQLLTTIGHYGRIRNEAAFARLTGVAPIPASSGKTSRVRLSRGGDRQANRALYLVAIGRRQSHPPSRAFYERKLAEGHTPTEAIRALKRRIARTLFTITNNTLKALDEL